VPLGRRSLAPDKANGPGFYLGIPISISHQLQRHFQKMQFPLLFSVALLSCSLAQQTPFWIEDNASDNLFDALSKDDEDFTTAFSGIVTFAHLPFINCLKPTYKEEAKEEFDIAIIGAPFDTSVTYRPG
jgi:hypothetical protein